MPEETIASMGPYLFRIERNSQKISKVEILDQSFMKGKNQINKIVQNKKVIQMETMLDEPVDAAGTPFQRKVWAATRAIPAGETRTYADIAKKIGHPKAVRAVGTALGKNPTCVIVPCHRVVPSSGGIGNYAFGVAMKKWLLDHEAGRLPKGA